MRVVVRGEEWEREKKQETDERGFSLHNEIEAFGLLQR